MFFNEPSAAMYCAFEFTELFFQLYNSTFAVVKLLLVAASTSVGAAVVTTAAAISDAAEIPRHTLRFFNVLPPKICCSFSESPKEIKKHQTQNWEWWILANINRHTNAVHYHCLPYTLFIPKRGNTIRKR